MVDEAIPNDRHIEVRQNAWGSAIVSGDGNKVFIYHYHLARQIQSEPQSSFASQLAPNPYRGLAAFQVEDADVYFGREAQVKRLWNRLRDLTERAVQSTPPVRLLPILGPSGCGKSSLARAGLLPELARRPLPGYKEPYVVVMTPGARPLEALAIVLARIATRDPSPAGKADEFDRLLRQRNSQGKHTGLRLIADTLPGIDTSPLVILIDQFEEVYSLCKDADERSILIDGLIEAAAAPKARVSVILTLRSDFLGEMQRHPHLSQIIGSDQSAIIPPMTIGELRRAIDEPARQAGMPLDKATIDLLIEQTKEREGALPLLEFALTRIWEGLQKSKLPADTLQEIGGVGGALAGEAERIYSGLSLEEQDITRRVFIGVVELGEGMRDTRRRTSVQSLISPKDNSDRFRHVIDRFAAPGVRLLTLSSHDGNELVEVTHEALFDHWQQLQNWLDNKRDIIRQQRRINTAADEWLQQGKKKGYLLQGKQLDTARAFDRLHSKAFPLSTNAVALLRESHRQRWRNRAWVASLAILPLFVVESYLREDAVKRDYGRIGGTNSADKPEAVKALVAGCEDMKGWSVWLYPIGERVFGNCRSLSNVDLSRGDSKAILKDINLSNANLSNANLYEADLSNANLSNANLSNAKLYEADLSNTNLQYANLSYASLSSGNLTNADLRGADLTKANLRDVDLVNADLHNADLRGVFFLNTDFHNADLSRTNLRGTRLNGNFRGGSLVNADLHNADLRGVFFHVTDLDGVNFGNADLSDALLSDATLSNTNLSKADIRGTIFLSIDLRGVEEFKREQLEGRDSPLLCNIALPKEITVNPNRDCDRIPQQLLKKHPEIFKTLVEAKAFVVGERQRKWD